MYSNFVWFKRNFQISKSFYLLTNYAKNRTILSQSSMGFVSFMSTKINLSASLGKQKKEKTKHSSMTNFDTQLHRSNEL